MSDELKDKEGQEGNTPLHPSQEGIQAETKNEAEKEYDAAWNEAGKELKEGEGEGSGEGLPEKAPEKEPEIKPKGEPAEDLQEKALRDTKSWATRLAMENAEMKKIIEAFRQGDASSQDVKDAHHAVAKAQSDLDRAKEKVYEDYPELKELLDPMLERSNVLEKEISELKTVKTQAVEQDRHKEALDYFNAIVKPEVLKVHSDFDDILFKTVEGKRTVNDEYFQWAEKQSPAMKFAAMESSDPQDIVMAVGAFKKFKNSDAAASLRQAEERKKKEKLVNAMSLRGGGTPIPTGHKRGDPEDYDSVNAINAHQLACEGEWPITAWASCCGSLNQRGVNLGHRGHNLACYLYMHAHL